MVAINMNLMPPKVIKKKVCLCARGPYGLSKVPKHFKEGRVKKKKGFYEGGRRRCTS
jgi:hypothetical protein